MGGVGRLHGLAEGACGGVHGIVYPDAHGPSTVNWQLDGTGASLGDEQAADRAPRISRALWKVGTADYPEPDAAVLQQGERNGVLVTAQEAFGAVDRVQDPAPALLSTGPGAEPEHFTQGGLIELRSCGPCQQPCSTLDVVSVGNREGGGVLLGHQRDRGAGFHEARGDHCLNREIGDGDR